MDYPSRTHCTVAAIPDLAWLLIASLPYTVYTSASDDVQAAVAATAESIECRNHAVPDRTHFRSVPTVPLGEKMRLLAVFI